MVNGRGSLPPIGDFIVNKGEIASPPVCGGIIAAWLREIHGS